MSRTYDEFVHVTTTGVSSGSGVAGEYFANAEGKRIYTEGVIINSIRAHHPKHHLTVQNASACNLLGFADAHKEEASYKSRDVGQGLLERIFIPPSRRYNDENGGAFAENVVFGCYDYTYQGTTFLVYIADGRDGFMSFTKNNYILVGPPNDDEDLTPEQKQAAQKSTDALIKACVNWGQELHDEVLVFDGGFWQKNRELWQNVQKSNWDDVILDKEKKKSIVEDVTGFFDGEDRYAEFGVPWKRGIIFYGPPGNGKTISTRALIHDCSKRTNPGVETLYVKSFQGWQGPEASIRQIFLKARQMAPCLLIFEDIDSLVNVSVRSYFLNEVDGLESNHGILMIGSTNHLEQLDPGIAKRPSRFDRKYLFDNPTREERILYCDFAYLKEAFVAALLVIVAREDKPKNLSHHGDELEGNLLWEVIQEQIRALREEMDDETVGKLW
ncbi:P-loop containing nucleoside triphosphate hydrolase protein [Xylogone sp. PMI_703]|nr:P-loop containing nucleoside triphosphate hydrolase protein [Xylogone sp. PMI_703]